jgi:hypothetical protein
MTSPFVTVGDSRSATARARAAKLDVAKRT